MSQIMWQNYKVAENKSAFYVIFFKFQISIRKLKIHDSECLGSQ